MVEFSLWRFGCSQIHGKHRGVLLLDRVLRCKKFEQLQVYSKVDFMSLLAVEENGSAVLRVILRTLDEWKCFRFLEKVILRSRLCLAKDEFRYHR